MAEEITTYAIAADITSPMGMGLSAHWATLEQGATVIKEHTANGSNFYGAKLTEEQIAKVNQGISDDNLSFFEQMCVYSAQQAMGNVELDLGTTCFVLSTTKGNINKLGQVADEQTVLHSSASVIAKTLGITEKPLVVSHACISGSVALLYAQRLIESGRYQNVVVTGCDRLTDFVLSGFQSFQAIADAPCKPFDADRTGINLGEAAATIILSSNKKNKPLGKLLGGATSNDANHISGPSRTGNELSDAINRAIQSAGVSSNDINMVSAHGTATAYNDEMEAKALNLSGLSNVPVHSMKSHTGHTLGAAGVLESAMVLAAIEHGQLIPSLGYKNHGVPVPLNVTTQMEAADIKYVVKTASGFGGSNAALVWGK